VGVCHFRVELRDINKGVSTTLKLDFLVEVVDQEDWCGCMHE
jgi:hypothetical protein